ncbi:MAG: proteasome activator, partial [Angustibacter sp.]
PSDAELRIAQAQLVGWLEGLFHGIQTALMAQQMAARAQLEEMRRALPAAGGPQAGPSFPGGPHPGQPGVPEQSDGPEHGTGQYL